MVAQVVNNLRFPGQYYDAEAGRYVSANPIGLAGGMNLFAYVGGIRLIGLIFKV